MIQVSSFHARKMVSFIKPEILGKVSMCVLHILSSVSDMPSLSCVQNILVKVLSNQTAIRIRGEDSLFQFSISVIQFGNCQHMGCD